jgi:hypothetical protein
MVNLIGMDFKVSVDYRPVIGYNYLPTKQETAKNN